MDAGTAATPDFWASDTRKRHFLFQPPMHIDAYVGPGYWTSLVIVDLVLALVNPTKPGHSQNQNLTFSFTWPTDPYSKALARTWSILLFIGLIVHCPSVGRIILPSDMPCHADGFISYSLLLVSRRRSLMSGWFRHCKWEREIKIGTEKIKLLTI